MSPPEETLLGVLRDRWLQLGHTREVVLKPVPGPARDPARWDTPEQLPGTGMISGYPELDGATTVVRMLRALPWLYRPIRDGVAALGKGKSGPKRMDGCWGLACVGWVDSPEADLQPWYGDTTDEFWQACGFAKRPSFATVWRRFTEMEQVRHVFAEALHQLVQHCRKQERRIGHAIVVDGTMVETNARPHRLTNLGKDIGRLGKLPVIAAPRMATTAVDDFRRAVNEAAPDAGLLQVGELVDVTEQISRDMLGTYRIFTSLKGVPYISRDPDAGFRVYTRDGKTIKWWHGYLILQAADHFTGLPLEAHGFAADEQEFKHYPEAVEKAIATTGHTPAMVTGDKGLAMYETYDWSVERGITLVTPYRKPNQAAPDKAQATIDFDEHGVPFCKHCQVSGTDQVGFKLLPPKGPGGRPRPILVVRCAAPQAPECERVQEVSCYRDPTRLLPVWRTHPAYIEARSMHQNYERSHKEARDRANAKPRHFETRSKRVSLKLTIMRANIGALIAWLRAAIINGWLGTPPLNPELEIVASRQRRLARQNHTKYIQWRTIEKRLRNGRVGGGRVPHRNRGGPARAPTT